MPTRLTVLNVAYPFAPVGPDTVGGAEQVLSALDRALVAAGHWSLVVGCAGSQIAGRLFATGALTAKINDDARRHALKLHRLRIDEALREWPIDIVHFHGHDFAEYLPTHCVPILVTLHLPVDHYPAEALSNCRPGLYFNCVSASQKRSFRTATRCCRRFPMVCRSRRCKPTTQNGSLPWPWAAYARKRVSTTRSTLRPWRKFL